MQASLAKQVAATKEVAKWFAGVIWSWSGFHLVRLGDEWNQLNTRYETSLKPLETILNQQRPANQLQAVMLDQLAYVLHCTNNYFKNASCDISMSCASITVHIMYTYTSTEIVLRWQDFDRLIQIGLQIYTSNGLVHCGRVNALYALAQCRAKWRTKRQVGRRKPTLRYFMTFPLHISMLKSTFLVYGKKSGIILCLTQ